MQGTHEIAAEGLSEGHLFKLFQELEPLVHVGECRLPFLIPNEIKTDNSCRPG